MKVMLVCFDLWVETGKQAAANEEIWPKAEIIAGEVKTKQ
jgi:hypothetical protein